MKKKKEKDSIVILGQVRTKRARFKQLRDSVN